MTDDSLPVIYLMGPTASGKTELAVELHRHLPVAIISVDSAMVYRGMDIGTAKPDAETLARAPHHLIDICDPADSYSAGRFCTDARGLIGQIHASGRIPLLVGGTGLYFRSLEQGLSGLPPADPRIRQRLDRLAAVIGPAGLHQRLAAVDPESARRIHANDPQRIQRALEIYEITGRPMSAILEDGRSRPLSHQLLKIVLAPADRKIIHDRVRQRFMQMIELGLVREVEILYQRGDLHPELPAMRMVGYRQVWRYLAGAINYQQMLDHAIVATRQLAKRQMTWLRTEANSSWFESTDRGLRRRILEFVRADPVFRHIV